MVYRVEIPNTTNPASNITMLNVTSDDDMNSTSSRWVNIQSISIFSEVECDLNNSDINLIKTIHSLLFQSAELLHDLVSGLLRVNLPLCSFHN